MSMDELTYERVKSFVLSQRPPVLNVEGVIGMQIFFGNSKFFNQYGVFASDGVRQVYSVIGDLASREHLSAYEREKLDEARFLSEKIDFHIQSNQNEPISFFVGANGFELRENADYYIEVLKEKFPTLPEHSVENLLALELMQIAADGVGNDMVGFLKAVESRIEKLPEECFTAGTSITLENGTEKLIEDIQIGDAVLTHSPDGAPVPGQVTKLFRNTTKEFVRLTFADRDDLVATPGHRFLTETGDYLEIGHMLRLGGGSVRLVDSTGAIVEARGELIAYTEETAHLFPQAAAKSIAYEGNAVLKEEAAAGWATYNFEVAEYHNYVADGIRVHNDSALSVITPEQWANATDVQIVDTFTVDGRTFVAEAIVRQDNGHTITDTRVRMASGDSAIVRSESTVEDANGNLIFVREVYDLRTGEVIESKVRPVFGLQYGAAIGDALTPFLTRAIIGPDGSIFEKIAADTFLGTTLESMSSVIGAAIDSGTFKQNLHLGEEFTTAAQHVFEDFGEELVVNGIESSISIVNQLILAEIFGSSADDSLGEAILRGLAGATVNNLLKTGANIVLSGEFFSELFQSVGLEGDLISKSLAVNLKEGFYGIDPLSIIITQVLGEIMPVETTEGAIASAVVSAILAVAGVADPIVAIATVLVGKLFDALFDKDPQAWTKVGFNEETGRFELTGTWSDDGGNTNLSEALAQSYVDAMNAVVDTVNSLSNNFDELGGWTFGHYEDALKNAGASGLTFPDFQEAYLNAYVDDLTEAQIEDGQMAAVRALEGIDVDQMRTDHRMRLLIEALDEIDMVIGVDIQTVQYPVGEGNNTTTTTIRIPIFAENLREKLEFMANNGGPVMLDPPTTGGEVDYDGIIIQPLDQYVLTTIYGGEGGSYSQWNYIPRKIDVQMQIALEQLTQSQTLLDLLATYEFETYDELLGLGGVSEQTLDDMGIYQRVSSTLQIAKDYNTYLANEDTIKSLIALEPTSAFAAGWLETLQYAAELGLTDPYSLDDPHNVANNFFTGEGHDTVYGRGGDDDIRTYSGNDVIYGGSGKDTIDAGSGTNTVRGNTGDDTYVITATTGQTRIIEQANQGNDVLVFDARFSNIKLHFDEGAQGFIAEWDDGGVSASGIEAVAFRFNPDNKGEAQVIEVNLADIRQGAAGINSLSGSAGSNYMEFAPAATGYTGIRTYNGSNGNDLYIYDKEMGNVRIMNETATSGAADRLILRDLNADEVEISMRTEGAQNYLDITWQDDTSSGLISINNFGGGIETVQFADGRTLNDVLIDNSGEGGLNAATGQEIVEAESDLLAFFELLNSQDILIGKTVTNGATFNYATNFRAKLAFFATDGSDTEIVAAVSGGEFQSPTPAIIAGPFDRVEYVTVGQGEDATVQLQWVRANLDPELTEIVLKFSQNQRLADFLAQDDFTTYAQFLATDFQPIVPVSGQGIYGTAGDDFIVVNASQNTVMSHGGNDTIKSTNGVDNIDSGDGDDLIFAGTGWDMIHSGAGDDTVYGGEGRDQIWLGDGDDVFIDHSQNNSNGHDTVYGGAGDDRLMGDGGRDTLYGEDGDDFLSGGINDDTLFGGHGDDTLSGGAGADALFGGDGIDQASYSSSTSGLIVDLVTTANNTGDAAGDVFDSIENLTGSFGDDNLRGDGAANEIWGGDGVDIIYGRGGDDTLHAGAGIGTQRQYLYGGTGSDTLVVQADSGYVGTSINAISEADNANDVDTILFSDINIGDVTFSTVSLTNTNWNDSLVISWTSGGYTGEYLIGGLGKTIERYEFADGTVLSEIDVDYWSGGRDRYKGTSKNDTIRTPDTNWAYTYGLQGNDYLLGGAGRDSLYGGIGDDVLSAGGNGFDTGFEFLFGESGNDKYIITSDDSSVFLDYNSDTETAGEIDTVAFADLDVAEVSFAIYDYTQGGTVVNNRGETLWVTWGDTGQLRIANMGANIERITFADGTTIGRIGINEDGAGLIQFHGTEGDDLILGAAGISHLYGHDGRDTLQGSDGGETLVGGAGNDRYIINHADDEIVEIAGEGYDHVFSSITYELRWDSQHTEALTLTGKSAINGTGNGLNNVITGNDANNRLNGAWGDDTLYGGNGADTFIDDGGNDVFLGGKGQDIFHGGLGNDRLTGGAHADMFIFAGTFGNDTITDFKRGNETDKIDLSGVLSITSFTDLSTNHMSQVGANTRIDDGSGNTITLLGISASTLTAGDFIY
ncbi:hypothetical protein [Thalassospira povalilytica]|uniref:hypothetical protein n=1 Tax=Thalassospira povalilytica TaxID=732237 RepID=UPI003AA9AF7F